MFALLLSTAVLAAPANPDDGNEGLDGAGGAEIVPIAQLRAVRAENDAAKRREFERLFPASESARSTRKRTEARLLKDAMSDLRLEYSEARRARRWAGPSAAMLETLRASRAEESLLGRHARRIGEEIMSRAIEEFILAKLPELRFGLTASQALEIGGFLVNSGRRAEFLGFAVDGVEHAHMALNIVAFALADPSAAFSVEERRRILDSLAWRNDLAGRPARKVDFSQALAILVRERIQDMPTAFEARPTFAYSRDRLLASLRPFLEADRGEAVVEALSEIARSAWLPVGVRLRARTWLVEWGQSTALEGPTLSRPLGACAALLVRRMLRVLD